jgi:hypothetical protein
MSSHSWRTTVGGFEDAFCSAWWYQGPLTSAVPSSERKCWNFAVPHHISRMNPCSDVLLAIVGILN